MRNKYFFIFISLLFFVYGCEKVIQNKIVIDKNKIFKNLKVEKIFSRKFKMEICAIPFKKGFIIGEQKGKWGFLTILDFKGNVIEQKEIEYGNTPDKIKTIFNSFYDKKKDIIYNISFPYFKKFNPFSLEVKTLFRTDHKSKKIGISIHIYPQSVYNCDTQYISRFTDCSCFSKEKELFGIGIINKDFSKWRVLKNFFKFNDKHFSELRDKKIIPVDYFYKKTHANFPIAVDNIGKTIYFIKDIWAPVLNEITFHGLENQYNFKLKKELFINKNQHELDLYCKWYKHEVIGGLLKHFYKKIKCIQPKYAPFFEDVMIYKKYILLFSGGKDWGKNKTDVYILNLENHQYLGKTLFPYAGDLNTFIYENYYIDIALEHENDEYFYELSVYNLELRK